MTEFIQPGWNAPASVRAFSTMRNGGYSLAPFDSLNLALHVGDDPVQVVRNRALLKQALSLPAEPCWINQTHGTHAVTLEQDSSRDADCSITRRSGTVAVVMTADCLPILVCSRGGTEVAAIHAGWRGLQAGVIQSALATMTSDNEQLMAWVGPGISQDNFEVGEDVCAAFVDSMPDAATFFQPIRQRHWLCDLAGLAESVLRSQGVIEVYRDPGCTYRDTEKFFSYRRHTTTGRMASLIWIK